MLVSPLFKWAYFMRYLYCLAASLNQSKVSSILFIAFSYSAIFYISPLIAVPPIKSVPNAGTLGNEIRQTTIEPQILPHEAEIQLPKLAIPSSNRSVASSYITLREVKLEGETSILNTNNKDLQAVLNLWLDRPLTFTDLQNMTLAITRFYRNKGWVAAQAILSPQTVHDGIILIRVISGRLDKPEVNNQSRLNTQFVTALIKRNSCSKEVGFFGETKCSSSLAELSRLERTALILNEIPGIDASLTLKPGSQSGMTRIYADITPGQLAMGYIGVDNQGNDFSGHNRLLAGGSLNNLTGWGDQLRTDLILSSSTDVFSGLLDYSFPINSYGTRTAIHYSHLNYTLTGPFEVLDAHGYSDTWGIHLRHPWIRNSQARINANTGYYQARMRDSIIMLPKQKRNLDAGELGIDGGFSTLSRGLSHVNLLGTAGHLSLDDEFSQSINSLTGISGTFARFNYRIGHDQGIGPYFSFFNQFTGQMTSKNLDSSQKLLLGGPLAVRAYGIGDGAVDKGTLFTTELRTRWQPSFSKWVGVGHQITVAAFFDQGWGDYSRQPIEGLSGNNINLSGFGAYIAFTRSADYSLNMIWAHRTGQKITSNQNNDQLWLSAYKMF